MRESGDATGDVTRWLRELKQSRPVAESRLYEVLYADLRRIAASHLRRERPNHTLTPTALVHEAWIRFTKGNVDFQNRNHFFAIAAKAMRRILVDYARARGAESRGGGQTPIPLDGLLNIRDTIPEGNILGLEEAMQRLEAMSARAAQRQTDPPNNSWRKGVESPAASKC